MTEMTKTGHVGLWFRCVRLVGYWVVGFFGTVLSITEIHDLVVAHHSTLATLLAAVILTVGGGTMFYVFDRFVVNPRKYR
jgi:hypothetical protein